MGLGFLGLPQTSGSQDLPEHGLPKQAGPAWDVKGRPDPLTFPKGLKKQEGSWKVRAQAPDPAPGPHASQAWRKQPPCGGWS